MFVFIQTCSSSISSYLPEEVGNQEKFRKLSQLEGRDALNILYLYKEQRFHLSWIDMRH